ncbi:MAG: ankyrin repeat domain-containing protein, partial [Puniceicoccales bacterium]|nr:ankyrin repeat domain-containing protein [Puniceicoccales bacterium]
MIPTDKNDYGRVPLMPLVAEINRATSEYFVYFNYPPDLNPGGGCIEYAEETLQRVNYMLEALALLVNHGANINAQDDGGSTPLHWAIMPQPRYFNEENSDEMLCIYKHLNLKLLKKLIKLGADVNIEDNDGRTPLDGFALREKLLKNEYDLEAIMLLRKCGAVEGRGYSIYDMQESENAKINFLLKKVRKNEFDKATTFLNEHGAVESQPRDEIESQPQEKDEAEDGEYNAEESEGADE